MVLEQIAEALVFFARSGRPVRLERIGIFSPTIDLSGDFSISYRLATNLATALDGGRFRGEVAHREHIGASVEELRKKWNEEHPDDPIA